VEKLICGDAAEELKKLESGSVDLTVTSPPYDNLRKYNGFTFNFKAIAQELYRVTKQGGVVVWVVNDATIEGSETGTSFMQALYFKSIGFNLHDTMIYKKINPIPLTHNRYEQYFEYMFVFSRGRPKTFNPILEQCLTSGAYKHRRNSGRVAEAATRNRDEITLTKSKKYKSNIWEYTCGSAAGETRNHPAPFPLKLAKEHVLSWSNEKDLVLDPMMGSGTVGVACKDLNRNFIGIEISKEYFESVERRISNTQESLF
jgi:site-specific DNA-methyltransferase (adenine-specific)